MIKKKQHGGVREGAGRKPQDGATGLQQYGVMLDKETVRKAKEIGSGSLSVGIRLKFREG